MTRTAYTCFSLLTFCLSFIAVYTSTVANTTLLLGRKDKEMATTMAASITDTYGFLRKTPINFEFVVTRWSFLSSLLCLLMTMYCRCIIEFGIYKKGTSLPTRIFALSTMIAMVSHTLSFINTSLICWPNLFMMTIEVGKLMIERGVMKWQQNPLELVAIVAIPVSFVSGILSLSGYSNKKTKIEDVDNKK